MTDLLSFTWSRDPQGYVFRNVVPDPLPPGTLRTTATDVNQEPRRVLFGVSGKLEDYSPLEGNRALFQEIADTEQTEAGVLLFAGRYGLLTDHKAYPEDFDEWCRTIQDMGRTLKLAFARDVMPFIEAWNRKAEQIARAHLRFVPHGHRRPTLQLVPRTLFDAAMIQLSQAVAGDQKMLVCDNCGRSFLVGTATSRRATSKFCGTTCRKAWHRRQRRG